MNERGRNPYLSPLSAAATITTSLYRNPSAARVGIRSGRKRVA